MRTLILTLIFVFSIFQSEVFAQFKVIENTDSSPITEEQRAESRILSNVSSRAAVATQSALTKSLRPTTYQSLKLKGTHHQRGINKFGGPKYINASGNADQRANFGTLIHEFASAIKVSDISSEAQLTTTWEDELGHTHHRFSQIKSGYTIYGSESILHMDEKGKVYIQSDLVPDDYPLPILQDELSISQIKSIVSAEVGGIKSLSAQELTLINGGQFQIENIYYPTDQNELIQAYHVRVYPTVDNLIEVFVSADGKIIHRHSGMCKFHNHEALHHESSIVVDGADVSSGSDLFGLNRSFNSYEVGTRHYLIDASRSMFNVTQSNLPNEPVGVIWTIDAFNTSPQNNNFNYDHVSVSNNNWSSKETEISAHYNGGLAYEYFNEKFGRNAIDDMGGNIISIVNVSDENGSSMGNAFWNGAAMFYGNGNSAFKPLGRGLDVAGHELSHGVIQNTANLEYQGESGALNESFADIFGAMIDRDDWLIGEDVVQTSSFPSGALRSLQDPHNGASTNDFNSGWQPRHYNERFTGSQDNGGVHINSGIPNFAFFKFATAVGKETAENVYYRALTTYLTRSSQFVDCRNAVVKAAEDIGNASVVAAANTAFDEVGIGSSGGGNYENDAESNEGAEFILYAATDLSSLKLAGTDGSVIVDPFEGFNGVISKPSVTDDGSLIMFVGSDKKIYRIDIDWASGSYDVEVFDDQPIWRNVIVSKDGQRLAALADELEPFIYVFEFATGETRPFELYNPTFSEGVSTGDVNYADAMEFDLTGQSIIYDAINTINGNTGDINYWDIGIIDVHDRSAGTWASGNIGKLFTALPENTSIGNPTFSKNSPYIIAFDVLEGNLNALAGYNIETATLNTITELADLAWPNYSVDDTRIIYDNPWIFGLDLGILSLNPDKISSVPNSEDIIINSARWGVWFSNGIRDLYVNTDDIDSVVDQISATPNPASTDVIISGKGLEKGSFIEIIDIQGRIINRVETQGQDAVSVDLSDAQAGIYSVRVIDGNELLGLTRLVIQ